MIVLISNLPFMILLLLLLVTSTTIATVQQEQRQPEPSLSEIQKTHILQVFNKARASTTVSAANMRILTWDEDIAREMQEYTDGCDDYWQRFDNPPALFVYRDHTADPVEAAISRSTRMTPFYDYDTGGCVNSSLARKNCRNPESYAALVFAGNERIGCGTTKCGPGPRGTFHACAVAPNPDYEDQTSALDWIAGPRCSQCPTGYNYCMKGLCSRTSTLRIITRSSSSKSNSMTDVKSRIVTATRIKTTTKTSTRSSTSTHSYLRTH